MITNDRLRFAASNLAAIDGVEHGFFTREGGVSEGIYTSLNCGPGSKDRPSHVIENRTRVAERLGARKTDLVTVYQKHSNVAVVAEAPWALDQAPEADAIVTATPGLAVGILTADCAPVLFCDPEVGVIGAAHAGWRGAFSGIIEATVAAMTGLGAVPGRIRAAVGPAISQTAFEVGEDFRVTFLAEEPASDEFFTDGGSSGRPHFDLPRYVIARLGRAGVGDMADLGLCTYADEARLFSYRRSQHAGEPDYGRQISAIVLA